MNRAIIQQEHYWNHTVDDFDSIYSHRKSSFENFIDKYFRWDMYARYEYTLRQSDPTKNRTFLDIGCGTGKYSIELVRRGAKKVTGLDIAQNMLDVCLRRASESGVDGHCEFIRTDLLEYYTDSKFDISIGIGLFDYIHDPLPVLQKMHTLTRDKIIISVPRLWTWRAPIRKARLGVKGCPVFFYSRRRIIGLLEHANFRDIHIEKTGQLFCITAVV